VFRRDVVCFGVMQCVAVCGRVLQCVVMRCSVLEYAAAAWCIVLQYAVVCGNVLRGVVVGCHVLQYRELKCAGVGCGELQLGAVCSIVLQYVCIVLPCIAVSCGVLLCFAVRCHTLQCVAVIFRHIRTRVPYVLLRNVPGAKLFELRSLLYVRRSL